MFDLETFYQQHRNHTYNYPYIAKSDNKSDDITLRSKIPYLKLCVDGPWKQILEEVKKLDHMFVPHRDDGQTCGWSSLCLHGLGWDKTDTPYMYPEFRNLPDQDLPWDWTIVAEQCPTAYEYFKNEFPFQSYLRLRFMKLDAHGYIGPHTDGAGHILSAINISLNNPQGCEMVLADVGVVPFEDSGCVMAFNNSYPHMVWNQSDEPRYHMIVHGTQRWPWDQIICDSYDQAYLKNPELSKQ